jgi:hypothetical protein
MTVMSMFRNTVSTCDSVLVAYVTCTRWLVVSMQGMQCVDVLLCRFLCALSGVPEQSSGSCVNLFIFAHSWQHVHGLSSWHTTGARKGAAATSANEPPSANELHDMAADCAVPAQLAATLVLQLSRSAHCTSGIIHG